MKAKEKAANRERWIARVDKFRSSGQTQEEWCGENDEKISSLRYWIRKFARNAPQHR